VAQEPAPGPDPGARLQLRLHGELITRVDRSRTQGHQLKPERFAAELTDACVRGHHWLRNPRIPIGADMAMSCDFFYGGNPYDLNKSANGGFVYAKANAGMVAFYGSWYESRKGYPGAHEQRAVRVRQSEARVVGAAWRAGAVRGHAANLSGTSTRTSVGFIICCGGVWWCPCVVILCVFIFSINT
jgi:hypothetical protein